MDNYVSFATDYYINLVKKYDSKCLSHIIEPNCNENDEWGFLDVSDEAKYSKYKFLQHKYDDTVLLLVTNKCLSYCRYCFRKRVIMDEQHDFNLDYSLEYIKNKHIKHVILSGGDPLSLDFKEIKEILTKLGEIESIESIRIGTKLLAFDPNRLLKNKSFLDFLGRFNNSKKKIVFMSHFVLEEEISSKSEVCIRTLKSLGIQIYNQFPLLKSINDNPDKISSLIIRLYKLDVISYYIFQCRPVKGNKFFSLSIQESFNIITQALSNLTGVCKTPKFVLSHKTGKLEILGIENNHIFLRYHRAVNKNNYGKLFKVKNENDTYWVNKLEFID